jgi:membrane fusion protein, macrolide-specific efflux system
MLTKRAKIVIVVVVVAAVAAAVVVKRNGKRNQETREVSPRRATLQTTITTTGTVLPKNRLEVKPPVSGRAEEILVREGTRVSAGQTLAWMSSTERAALIDAARGQGNDTVTYWQETYKPIPLISPINGEVIVSKIQPGQTITTEDAVVVLSDELIVRAQVDETDIGKISVGQKAVITLDAYSDTAIAGVVEHIYYESKTVNNVTMYEVDIRPTGVPTFFRSGMSATIDFEGTRRENALMIPQEALTRQNGETLVMVKQAEGEPLACRVELGASEGSDVEVVSGITEKDTLIVKSKKYALPKDTTGTNPFTPQRKR